MEPENRLLQLLELLACAWWPGYVRYWSAPCHFHDHDVDNAAAEIEALERAYQRSPDTTKRTP
jgi:hypothetical protein